MKDRKQSHGQREGDSVPETGKVKKRFFENPVSVLRGQWLAYREGREQERRKKL